MTDSDAVCIGARAGDPRDIFFGVANSLANAADGSHLHPIFLQLAANDADRIRSIFRVSVNADTLRIDLEVSSSERPHLTRVEESDYPLSRLLGISLKRELFSPNRQASVRRVVHVHVELAYDPNTHRFGPLHSFVGHGHVPED